MTVPVNKQGVPLYKFQPIGPDKGAYYTGAVTFDEMMAQSIGSISALTMPVFDVVLFGASGNGVTNDTAAIAAAIAAAGAAGAGGGCVYFPPGTYLTTAPLVLVSGVRIIGASRLGSVITNTASAVFTATGSLRSVVVQHLGISSSPAAGYHFDFANAVLSLCLFSNIHSQIINGNYSFFNCPAMMDSIIRDCDLIGQARTVPFINLVGTIGALNDNLIADSRFTDYSPQAVAIRLAEMSTTTAFGNTFRGLNFENSVAGSLLLQSVSNTVCEDFRVWDMGATSTASQIKISVVSGTYPSSRGNKIRNYKRAASGFNNGSNCYDIELVQSGAHNTTIEGIECPNGATIVVQANFTDGTIIRDCLGVTLSQYYGSVVPGTSAGTGATTTIAHASTNQSPYEGVITVVTGTGVTAGPIAVFTYPNGFVSAAPPAVLLMPYSTNGNALAQAFPYISQASVNTFTIATALPLADGTTYQIMFASVRAPNV